MVKIKKKIVVLYHAKCRDGFGAAWAAWKKFGNRAAYIPVGHDAPPPPGLKSKVVYTVDFTYPLETTRKLMRESVRLTSIDHHISAEKVTRITAQYSYALHNSGSVLAWKYFHQGKKTPFLLRCVEDMDIWKWNIQRSREVLMFVDLFPLEFRAWNKLARDLESPARRREYVRSGGLLLRYHDRIVGDFVNSAEKVKFAGRTVYAMNTPSRFVDDVGNILAKKPPPFSVLWRVGSGKLSVSMRSSSRSVDLSKIAKKYGGGGHKASAAFSMPFRGNFPWKPIKK